MINSLLISALFTSFSQPRNLPPLITSTLPQESLYVSDRVSCHDLIQTLNSIPNLRVRDVIGDVRYQYYAAGIEYSLSEKLAMPKGIFTFEVFRHRNIKDQMLKRVNRHNSAIVDPPKMTEITSKQKIRGYRLFDDCPPYPESSIKWAAFVAESDQSPGGFEILIRTRGALNLSESGAANRISTGKLDLLPLSVEHEFLAKAILDEVYKRGKTLKLWSME